MIAIMWEFIVKTGREDDFERLYGADGEWTAANRVSRSYLGTSFLRDQTNPLRYVVTEYWSEMVVNERHRKHSAALTAEVQAQQATLVDAVEPLGIFTALDVPERTGPTWSRRAGGET